MPNSRKRKQHQLQYSPTSQSPSMPADATCVEATVFGQYPDHPRPTPVECLAVRDDLLSVHGFPEEFAKYRRPAMNSDSLDGEDGGGFCDSIESVLDGLVSAILSQNTTDANSRRAFASLKSAFPSWEDVVAAESTLIEDAIRCGGLAQMKAACVKNVLNTLILKKGKLCMEYLRDLSVDEVKAELSHFKGIGPKTVACVLLFQLQRADFPVDTHIFRIAKAIGWLPETSDIKRAYLHLNRRIPDELKFDLNCLLFTHGKACQKCSMKKGNSQVKKKPNDQPCPLLKYYSK